MRGLHWLLATAIASLAVTSAGAAGETCSASATASWKSKCASRTAGNRDFLPLTEIASGEINIDDSTLADTYNQARLTALKLSGTVGSAAMNGMRKKSRTWYEASLRKVLTYLCAETATSDELERCVPLNSTFAERDVNGKCVVLTDKNNCNSKGMCERESNCKWDDAINAASFRREIFTSANVTTAITWMQKDYPTSFAGFLAPGIVFAVISALSCVAFLILRCVFNQCGGRNPREKGYTRCHILIPSVIFMVCSVAVFICCLVTIAQNTNISEGVGGVLNSLNVTMENIDIFAGNIKKPLLQASEQLQIAKASVDAQVNDLEWVATDGAKLQQMITDFGTYYKKQGPFPFETCDATKESCVVCPDAVCGAPLGSFTTKASEALAGTGGLVAKSIATMKEAFVTKSDNISISLKVATMEIGGLANMTESSKKVVSVIKETFDDYSFSRSALVLSVFLFGVLASLIGVFAIFKGVCKRESVWVHMLHLSWLIGVLVCILGFVLASSLLAVGALWFDTCNYMSILHSDLTPYFPARASTIVNACFQDISILTPLNVDESLVFQCDLDDLFTNISSADMAAVNTLITSYGVQIANFGLRDFGFDASVSRTLIAAANTAAKDVDLVGAVPFSRDNIVTPWTAYGETSAGSACTSKDVTTDMQPVCYMDTKCATGTGSVSNKDKCKEAYTSAYYYTLSFSKISNMLDEMREDLLGDVGTGFSPGWKYDVSIREFAQDYFKRVAAVRTTSLDSMMKGEVGKVIETIERVRCTESCGWINISFNAVHEALCTDILGTTLAISLCVLFLCIFLIPMIVTGITLQKRLRGSKKGTYEELEKRLQQLESKQRDEARAKKVANSESSNKGIDLFKFKKNLDSA